MNFVQALSVRAKRLSHENLRRRPDFGRRSPNWSATLSVARALSSSDASRLSPAARSVVAPDSARMTGLPDERHRRAGLLCCALRRGGRRGGTAHALCSRWYWLLGRTHRKWTSPARSGSAPEEVHEEDLVGRERTETAGANRVYDGHGGALGPREGAVPESESGVLPRLDDLASGGAWTELLRRRGKCKFPRRLMSW